MTNAFSFEQMSVINGSILGDGHLSKPRGNGNSCFSKAQTARRREYLEWTGNILGEHLSSINEHDNWAAGKKYRKAILLSRACTDFTDLRHKWYPNGTKIVPRDLVLDPLSIAIWFFDDGSNDLKNRQVSFATYSFSKDDCQFLCCKLKEHSVDSYVSSDNVINVSTKSYKTFVDMVTPYMIWPFFKHKIQYRDSELKFTTTEESIEIQKLYSSGMKQKDIAVKMEKSISVVSNVLRGNLKVSKTEKAVLPLTNTSGVKNVCWDKSRNKWMASIKRDGKNINLGRFSEKQDAINAINNFV